MASVTSSELRSKERPTLERTESSARKTRVGTVWLGFRWAFLGNLVYAASQWSVYILLARIGSPELVGQYALAISIAGPVVFVSNMQLRAIQASDASRQYEFADFWCLRIWMAPIALMSMVLVAGIGQYDLAMLLVVLAMGGAKVVESFSDLCFGAVQRNDRLDLVGKSMAIKGLSMLLMIGLLVWLTQSVATGAVGVVFAWLGIFLWYDYPNVELTNSLSTATSLRPQWNWSFQKRLIALGLPMGLSMGLLSLTVALPNILVESYLGERQLGIFAALASLTWAGLPLINAMGQSAMPRLGQLFVSRDRGKLRSLVLGLALAGGVFGGIGVVLVRWVGEWVVVPIYGPEYAGHVDLLLWLMAAATVLYAVRFLADALTAMRCVRTLVYVQAISASCVLLGGLWILPEGGMVGMAKMLMLAFSLRGAVLFICFWYRTGQMGVLSESSRNAS